jgi:hypothetical protein
MDALCPGECCDLCELGCADRGSLDDEVHRYGAETRQVLALRQDIRRAA